MYDCDSKELQALITELTGPLSVDYEIHSRAMFGGYMFYTCGRPFASVSNAGIALKLSPEQRSDFIDAHDAYPLRYKPEDAPSKSYTVMPKDMVDEKGDALIEWLTTSMDYARTLPLKKKKPKKKI